MPLFHNSIRNGVAEMTDFVIRPAMGDDVSFIYATWLDSYRNDSNIGLSVKKSVFFDNYRLVLDHILSKNTTKVLVAVKNDDPSVIFGYMVGEPDQSILHYVFVKGAFHGFGIATALFNEMFDGSGAVVITHRTKTAQDLCEEFTYNPFLLYEQGEINV